MIGRWCWRLSFKWLMPLHGSFHESKRRILRTEWNRVTGEGEGENEGEEEEENAKRYGTRVSEREWLEGREQKRRTQRRRRRRRKITDELTFFEFVSNTSSWRIHGSNVLITTSWTISTDWVFTDWCFCCWIHSLTIIVILNWIHSPAPLGISPTKSLSMRVYLCCCCCCGFCCCVGCALFFDCSWSLVLCYFFVKNIPNENAELVHIIGFSVSPLFFNAWNLKCSYVCVCIYLYSMNVHVCVCVCVAFMCFYINEKLYQITLFLFSRFETSLCQCVCIGSLFVLCRFFFIVVVMASFGEEKISCKTCLFSHII